MSDPTISTTARKTSAKSRLAAATAAVTKNILGAGPEKPQTVLLPQAVSEIHVSPEDVIPAGTVITDEVAQLAGLDADDLADLEDAGHVKSVEVLAMALQSGEAA